jgi:DNA-binding NtrC family response regulator
MVAQGHFREDLYYRLSTFPIHLPALREHRDDVPLLATALLERVTSSRKLSLSDDAVCLLQQQNYPGNVRELRNLLERAALLCDGTVLEASHVTLALRSGRRSGSTSASSTNALTTSPTKNPEMMATAPNQPVLAPVATQGALNAASLAALRELAQSHAGSRADLATKLGISERSLYRKLKALGSN